MTRRRYMCSYTMYASNKYSRGGCALPPNRSRLARRVACGERRGSPAEYIRDTAVWHLLVIEPCPTPACSWRLAPSSVTSATVLSYALR